MWEHILKKKNYIAIYRLLKRIEEKTIILLKIITYIKNENLLQHINTDYKEYIKKMKKCTSIVVRRHDNATIDSGIHPLFKITTNEVDGLKYAQINFLNDPTLDNTKPIYYCFNPDLFAAPFEEGLW